MNTTTVRHDAPIWDAQAFPFHLYEGVKLRFTEDLVLQTFHDAKGNAVQSAQILATVDDLGDIVRPIPLSAFGIGGMCTDVAKFFARTDFGKQMLACATVREFVHLLATAGTLRVIDRIEISRSTPSGARRQTVWLLGK